MNAPTCTCAVTPGPSTASLVFFVLFVCCTFFSALCFFFVLWCSVPISLGDRSGTVVLCSTAMQNKNIEVQNKTKSQPTRTAPVHQMHPRPWRRNTSTQHNDTNSDYPPPLSSSLLSTFLLIRRVSSHPSTFFTSVEIFVAGFFTSVDAFSHPSTCSSQPSTLSVDGFFTSADVFPSADVPSLFLPPQCLQPVETTRQHHAGHS